MIRVVVLVLLGAACSGSPHATTPAPPPAVKTAAVTDGKVEDHVLEGYVTLVDFWADYCGACLVVADKIEAAIANDTRVIVRKVDVGDGATPVAVAYQIGTLPHWKIYDTHRRLRYVLIGSETLRAPTLARELLSER